MDIAQYMTELGAAARQASRVGGASSTAVSNQAQLAAQDGRDGAREPLAQGHAEDMERGRGNPLAGALLDRLELTPPPNVTRLV